MPPETFIPDDLLALASPAELAAYEKALRVEKALLSPLNYALHVSERETRAYRHIVMLDAYLVALVEGRLYRDGPGPAPCLGPDHVWRHPTRDESPVYHLTISMPPRHGKSYLVSDHMPAWFLTKHPDLRLILSSYEADFAASWGGKAKRHIEEFEGEFDVRVDKDTRANARWNLHGRRGGMTTAGAGGAITGKGAHLFIIDDPIKNSEEAFSATQRNSLDDWYLSTAYTRLEPWEDGTPGRMILMNTRWHEDDLNGRVTARDPEMWCVLNLPALAEPTEEAPDPLGRQRDEALCPERFTTTALKGMKAAQGAYFWAAMYQGRPNIEGGGLIARPFRYHRLIHTDGQVAGTYELTDSQGTTAYVPELECYRFATMDVAGSVKTSADWTVYAVWDLTPSGILLLHARYRRRMETPDHEEVLREWFNAHPRTRFVGIEDKTFGSYLIKTIIKHGGISVRPMTADTDKIQRAIPYGNAIKNGIVSFPAGADWLQEWEHEHLQFPNGTHDDQVDCGAYAVRIQEMMPNQKPPRENIPQTAEARVEAYVQRRFKKAKGRGRHPQLGRM